MVSEFIPDIQIYVREGVTKPWKRVTRNLAKIGEHMKLIEILKGIVARDVEVLTKKDAEYGSSWKKRGGVGAFMMAARKWDRLETQVTNPALGTKYDIFDAIEQKVGSTEDITDTIRDLRAYLLLIESEMVARNVVEHYGAAQRECPPVLECKKVLEELSSLSSRSGNALDHYEHGRRFGVLLQLLNYVYPGTCV